MKNLIFLCLLISSCLAESHVQNKNTRKVSCPDCNGSQHNGQTLDCKCDDPCDEYESPGPVFKTKTYTPMNTQEVNGRTVLVCSPGSYFDRIEYDGSYKYNTTCNGVVAGSGGYTLSIFTGVRKEDSDKEIVEQINAANYKFVANNNNGNAIVWEEATLGLSGKCSGDILRFISNWVADDPLTGCCDKGVNRLKATAYYLNIYGKCFSKCNLLQTSMTWKKPFKN